MNKVIGLFGMMCSGKDTVAELLEGEGYEKISISEHILKPILTKMRLVPDRLNYIKLGRALKDFKEESLAFLAHSLINKGDDGKYIIPNIMTFKEAQFLKEQEDINFILIKVSANQKTRFERNLKRKSTKDVTDLAEFKRLDTANLTRTGLKELMHAKLENVEVKNEGTRDELESKVKGLIKEFDL